MRKRLQCSPAASTSRRSECIPTREQSSRIPRFSACRAHCMGVPSEKPRHRELTICLKSEVSQWRQDWRGPRTRKSFVLFGTTAQAESVARWAYCSTRCSRRNGTRLGVPTPGLQPKQKTWSDTRRTRPRWKRGVDHSSPAMGRSSLSKLEPCQLPWLVIVAHDGFVSIQQFTKTVAGSRRKGVHGAFTLTLAPSHRSALDVHHTAYVRQGPPTQLDPTASSPS